MKLIHATIVFLLYSFLMPAQSIPGYLYYNTIQDNAAYAGQDSFSINISSNINADYVKPRSKRINFLKRQVQLFATYDLENLNSGVGIFSEYYARGGETDIAYHQQYKFGIIYNYNFKINNNLNLRFGFMLNEIVTKNLNYNFRSSIWSASYTPDNDVYEYSSNKITVDPAIWIKYKKISMGFTVKNIYNNSIEARTYVFSAFYDRIRSSYVDVIPAFEINQFKYNDDQSYTNFNPQINFEFAKAILINFGYTHYSNNNFETKFFTLGLGAKISSHLSLLLNFKNAEEHDQYISGMLKLNF